MGAAQSEDDKSGWRILKVVANSPCDQLGLVPYFDVVTHVNGMRLNSNQASLLTMITEGTPTKLTILNYPQSKSREVTVVPSRGWGGNGLLGLVLRFDCYENADADVIHVLEVYDSSPAQKAGLQPTSDYLLGTAEIAFKGYDHLDYFLEHFDNKPTSMFVFNSQTYRVREAIITPNRKWGGQGSLGCNLGIGLLHRLPLQSTPHVGLEPPGNHSNTSQSNPTPSSNSSTESNSVISNQNLESTPSPTKTIEKSGVIPDSEPELYNPPTSMESSNSLDNIMTQSSSPFYPGRHLAVGMSPQSYLGTSSPVNNDEKSSFSGQVSGQKNDHSDDHHGHSHNPHGHSHDSGCDGHHH